MLHKGWEGFFFQVVPPQLRHVALNATDLFIFFNIFTQKLN